MFAATTAAEPEQLEQSQQNLSAMAATLCHDRNAFRERTQLRARRGLAQCMLSSLRLLSGLGEKSSQDAQPADSDDESEEARRYREQQKMMNAATPDDDIEDKDGLDATEMDEELLDADEDEDEDTGQEIEEEERLTEDEGDSEAETEHGLESDAEEKGAGEDQSSDESEEEGTEKEEEEDEEEEAPAEVWRRAVFLCDLLQGSQHTDSRAFALSLKGWLFAAKAIGAVAQEEDASPLPSPEARESMLLKAVELLRQAAELQPESWIHFYR